MIKTSSVIALALLLVGCGSRSYEITIKNQSPSTITLWLTKDGGPAEEGWLSPEQLATSKHERARYDLANVLAGDTGYTGSVSGKFDSKTNAVLRVYRGNFDLVDIVRERAAHYDYVLKPGKNNLVATDEGKSIAIKPAEPTPEAK